MSEQPPNWGPPPQPSPSQAWPPPAPQPIPAGPGPAPYGGAESLIQTEYVTSGGRGSGGRIAIIAAVLGAAVLLAGAGWLVARALTASDGADSPEAATDALIDAINNEDFLTMAELLEPGERRAIAEPVLFEIVPELQRLGLLGDDFDTSETQGLELDLSNVTYRVDRPIDSPDVAFVYFTGGTSTSSLDLDEFQLGSRLREEIEQDPDAAAELERSETTDLASETPVVMVERDGRWYVSMVYTVMEGAFPGELPAQVAGLTPVGADSPEAAVERMLQAAVDLDARAVIEGLEPGEMHALHRYSPLFLDDLQRALDEVSDAIDDDGTTITLTDLDLERADADGTTLVRIRGFVVEVQGPSLGTVRIEYGRELIAVDFAAVDSADRIEVRVTPRSLVVDGTLEGEAIRFDVDGSADGSDWTVSGQIGAETVDGTVAIDDDCWPYRFEQGGEVADGCLIDDLGSAPFDTTDLPTEFGGLPLVVAETDGQWYVSPMGSMMYGVVEGLRSLDESDLDEWFEGDSLLNELDPTGIGGLGILGEGVGIDDTGGDPIGGPVTSLEAPLAVAVGQTVTETQTLGTNENHRWTVVLADGEALAATLDGGGGGEIADPVLEVYDDQGVSIGFNDDYDGLNSGLRLVGPGSFVLSAYDLAGDGGDYRLTVEVGAGLEAVSLAPDAPVIGGGTSLDPPAEVAEDVEVVDLNQGPFVASGSVADRAYDEFVIESSGQPIIIELVPGPDSDVDPFLVVLDATGTEIASNDDDDSGELPALSSRVVLQAPEGSYTIEARSFFGRGGDYEIRIAAQ